MFQQVMIAGKLRKTFELRHTPQGKPVTTLSVATSRTWN